MNDIPLKYALVGAGTIARNHLAAIGKLKGCGVLDSIADVNPAAASALAGSAQTAIYGDYRRMIKERRPDVVVVCTPPFLHHDVACFAVENGSHVLCEKPLAPTVAECRRMIAAAAGNDRILTVNHQRRCEARYQQLHQLLESGTIGRIHRANLYCSNRFRPKSYYQPGRNRCTWSSDGGGVLLNHVVHELDLLLWVMGGQAPKSALSYCRTLTPGVVAEDDAYVILEFDDGAAGVVHASLTDVPGRLLYEFVGSHGTIELTDEAIRVTRLAQPIPEFHKEWKKPFGRPASSSEVLAHPPETGDSFLRMHENLLRVIRQPGERLMVPAADAERVVETVNAAYLSSARREVVELPLDADLYQAWFDEKVRSENLEPAETALTL